MTGYTKGPWKWWTSNSFLRLSGADGKDGGVICPTVSRSDGHPDLIVSKADMALIESAPDLLEALTEMIQAHKSAFRTGYDRIIELGGDCDPPEMMIASNPDIAKAIKAITKAKGEST